MATTLLRTTIKQRLITVITAALPGVQVSYAFPGQHMEQETVFLTTTEGEVEISAMTGAGSRRRRHDNFAVAVVVVVSTPGISGEDAEVRCEALLAAIDDALASATVGPTLGTPTIDGLLAATTGPLRGPESEPRADGNGFRAVGELVVDVRTRLV